MRRHDVSVAYINDPLGPVRVETRLTGVQSHPISLYVEEKSDYNAIAAWLTLDEARVLKKHLKAAIKEAEARA